MSELPDFGHGNRSERMTRRIAVGTLVVVILVIAALGIYALAS